MTAHGGATWCFIELAFSQSRLSARAVVLQLHRVWAYILHNIHTLPTVAREPTLEVYRALTEASQTTTPFKAGDKRGKGVETTFTFWGHGVNVAPRDGEPPGGRMSVEVIVT